MNGSFNLKDKMMLCVGILGNFCEYVRFLHRFLYASKNLIISPIVENIVLKMEWHKTTEQTIILKKCEWDREATTLYTHENTYTYRGSGPNATISIGNIVNDDYNVLFTLCACYFVISSINKPINIQVLYSICRWQLVFSSLIRRCRESHQHWDPFLAALIKLYIYTIFFLLLSSFLSFYFCWKIHTKYSKYTQICSQQFAISHTSISMICFIRKLRIK